MRMACEAHRAATIFVAPHVAFVETVAREGGFAGFSYLWTRAEHILAASFHHMADDMGARCQ